MPRREPITDVHLRELAVRYRKSPQTENLINISEAGEKKRQTSLPPLSDGLQKLIIDDADIPASKREDVGRALAAEIELYQVSQIISKNEGPDSVAETIRLLVDRLKDGRQALLGLPAVPHTRTLNARLYLMVADLLAIIIDENEIARQNAQVSYGRAKKRQTRLRNDFALGLKGIVTGLKSEREAERWASEVLSDLKIAYPNPETRADDFRQMFGIT